MYIVLNSRCFVAKAKLIIVLEWQISSSEVPKINKYYVALFFNEAINSKFMPRANSDFSIYICITPQSAWE